MNPHKLLPTLSSITTSDEWYTYYKANAEFCTSDSSLDWSSSRTQSRRA